MMAKEATGAGKKKTEKAERAVKPDAGDDGVESLSIESRGTQCLSRWWSRGLLNGPCGDSFNALVPILAGRNGSILVGHVSTGKMDSQDKFVSCHLESIYVPSSGIFRTIGLQ